MPKKPRISSAFPACYRARRASSLPPAEIGGTLPKFLHVMTAIGPPYARQVDTGVQPRHRVKERVLVDGPRLRVQAVPQYGQGFRGLLPQQGLQAGVGVRGEVKGRVQKRLRQGPHKERVPVRGPQLRVQAVPKGGQGFRGLLPQQGLQAGVGVLGQVEGQVPHHLRQGPQEERVPVQRPQFRGRECHRVGKDFRDCCPNRGCRQG